MYFSGSSALFHFFWSQDGSQVKYFLYLPYCKLLWNTVTLCTNLSIWILPRHKVELIWFYYINLLYKPENIRPYGRGESIGKLWHVEEPSHNLVICSVFAPVQGICLIFASVWRHSHTVWQSAPVCNQLALESNNIHYIL